MSEPGFFLFFPKIQTLHRADYIELTDFITADEILRDEEIRCFFSFLDSSLEYFISNREYYKIKPLYLATRNHSFDEVLLKFLNVKNVRPYRKRMGKLILKSGTDILNALLVLRRIFPYTNIDKLLNYVDLFKPDFNLLKTVFCSLDHTRLSLFYSEDRVLKLLQGYDVIEVEDLSHMMKRFAKNHLELILPRKPKNITEIHDVLVTNSVTDGNLIGKKFTQAIDHFHCVTLREYTIEVPNSYETLLKTGRELNHCVAHGGYFQRIKRRECYILNLLFKGKRVYTVELTYSEPTGYQIVQFKGQHNRSHMEGPEGKELREALLAKLNSPPEKLCLPAEPIKTINQSEFLKDLINQIS